MKTKGTNIEEKLIFDYHIRIAEMIGRMFEPILEVVVHDLRTPDRSIIYIYNSHITGRKKGEGSTDLGLRRLRKENVPDMLINYPNESPLGQRLKSSSLSIKNQEGEIIGSLCLNLSLANFEQMKSVIDNLLRFNNQETIADKEDFITSPAIEIKKAIQEFRLREIGNSENLSKDDKKKLIQILYDKGYFNIRGAVSIIAMQLNLTRASIYNYLKKISKENFE